MSHAMGKATALFYKVQLMKQSQTFI